MAFMTFAPYVLPEVCYIPATITAPIFCLSFSAYGTIETKGVRNVMLTTVEGVYKDGKIELTEVPAGLKQAQVLVTFLPDNISANQPEVLYGVWQGKMPVNLDIDAV